MLFKDVPLIISVVRTRRALLADFVQLLHPSGSQRNMVEQR